MTREEAIKELKEYEDGLDLEYATPFDKAILYAIKALEQEPKVDWDELKRKIFMEVDSGTDDKWLRYADVCDNISKSIDDFKTDLPSVTTQKPILDKIRAEIIQSIQNGTLKIESGNEELFRIIDKYKGNSEDKE